MATATDCDFLAKIAFGPDGREKFFNNPSGQLDSYHFTPHDVHDTYDAIDVNKNQELKQDGKVVLITGARGIGRAIAVAFARAGAKAIAVGARTESQLEETRQEILKANPDTQVHVQHLDVTSDESVKSFFSTVKAKFKTIDIAISNSGANDNPALVADTDSETWWNEIEVNLKGTYLISKYFMRSLAGQPGTLISISSSQAVVAVPTQTAYCSSKVAAMRHLECVHFEAPNLRVFSVHPGLVDTEMSRKHGTTHKWAWTYSTPDLVAGTALWLTTARAEFLRGRWISAEWKVDELEAKADEIVKGNLLKSAFNARLGKEGP